MLRVHVRSRVRISVRYAVNTRTAEEEGETRGEPDSRQSSLKIGRRAGGTAIIVGRGKKQEGGNTEVDRKEALVDSKGTLCNPEEYKDSVNV